jgi:hypothetical protein
VFTGIRGPVLPVSCATPDLSPAAQISNELPLRSRFVDGLVWALLGLGVLLLVAWYLSWSAARLDRLHARVEGARAALDAQLLRRSSVALELATSGLLDPAAGVLLAGAAHDATAAPPEDREIRESDLSRALRAALAEPETVAALRGVPWGAASLDELSAAGHRVQLARRFYNDAVRSARAVRRKPVVRTFRLAGRAPAPETFEMDDAPPLESVSAV